MESFRPSVCTTSLQLECNLEQLKEVLLETGRSYHGYGLENISDKSHMALRKGYDNLNNRERGVDVATHGLHFPHSHHMATI